MHAQCVHLPLRVLAGAADLGALRLQRGIDFDAGHRSRRGTASAHEAPGQQAGTDHAGPGQHQQPRLQMDERAAPWCRLRKMMCMTYPSYGPAVAKRFRYHSDSVTPVLPAMSFRPLPAQASTQLLRQAGPLQMLFAEAQRICRLQQLLESQLQPAARPYCHVASGAAVACC